jgi:hypothetical protein
MLFSSSKKETHWILKSNFAVWILPKNPKQYS